MFKDMRNLNSNNMYNMNPNNNMYNSIPRGVSDDITDDTQYDVIPDNYNYNNGTNDFVNNMDNENMYQAFFADTINRKCWDEEYFNDFVNNVNVLSDMGSKFTNNNEAIAVLLDPNYSNLLHKTLDDIDSMNIACAIQGKCDVINNMINDPKFNENIYIIEKLVDLYVPILIRATEVCENVVSKIGQTCNIDESYLNRIRKIKEKIFGNVYIGPLSKYNTELNNYTSNVNSEYNYQMANANTNTNANVEAFYSDSYSATDCLTVVIIIILIILIIYLFFNKNPLNATS